MGCLQGDFVNTKRSKSPRILWREYVLPYQKGATRVFIYDYTMIKSLTHKICLVIYAYANEPLQDRAYMNTSCVWIQGGPRGFINTVPCKGYIRGTFEFCTYCNIPNTLRDTWKNPITFYILKMFSSLRSYNYNCIVTWKHLAKENIFYWKRVFLNLIGPIVSEMFVQVKRCEVVPVPIHLIGYPGIYDLLFWTLNAYISSNITPAKKREKFKYGISSSNYSFLLCIKSWLYKWRLSSMKVKELKKWRRKKKIEKEKKKVFLQIKLG